MNNDPAVVRVYRTLIHLYPREFRDDYGTDLVQLIREHCDDEGSWRVSTRAALDLAITIPTQHLEVHMNAPSTHLVPLIIAWRRSGPVGDRISTNVWWKLVLTGPCIIAAVVIAAGLGVNAWMLGMLAVFVAFVVTATGVLLGIARLAQRHSRAIPT